MHSTTRACVEARFRELPLFPLAANRRRNAGDDELFAVSAG